MSERTAPCRGCGADIIWKYTEAGKRMPLNAESIPEPVAGAYRIDGQHCIAAQPMFDPPGTVYRLNHWATCPVADSFKEKRS